MRAAREIAAHKFLADVNVAAASKTPSSCRERRILRLASSRPSLEMPSQASTARRVCRSVDELEPADPVQGVKAAAGPAGIGTQHAMESLLGTFIIAASDLHHSNSSSVSERAVLH